MADPIVISPLGNEPIFPGDYLIVGVKLPATGGAVPPLSDLLRNLRADTGTTTWDAQFAADSSGKHSGFIVYCHYANAKTNGSRFAEFIESKCQQTFGYPVKVTSIVLESRVWGDPGKENKTKPPDNPVSYGINETVAAIVDMGSGAIQSALGAIGLNVEKKTAGFIGAALIVLGIGVYVYKRKNP